jgi:hypothetical protein
LEIPLRNSYPVAKAPGFSEEALRAVVREDSCLTILLRKKKLVCLTSGHWIHTPMKKLKATIRQIEKICRMVVMVENCSREPNNQTTSKETFLAIRHWNDRT